MKPEISIVIPVYDEEDNIKTLYREICSSMEPLNTYYEIIFIDDGSTDQTFARLKEIKKNDRSEAGNGDMRLIRFSRNFGQTAAMQAGFDHAKGHTIVSMDGDLQNDPRDIPKLVEMLKTGYDVVCGWRKDRQDKTMTRVLPSKAANWLIRKITRVPIHDNGCSLKAYRRSVIQSVRLYSDMHRFIPAITTLAGAKVAEIVVHHRARKHGKPKYGLSRIWRVFFDMITIKMLIHFQGRPIVWFAGIGFIFLFFGALLGVASIIHYAKGGYSIVLITASVMLLFIHASLLFWGLIAEFFMKIEKGF